MNLKKKERHSEKGEDHRESGGRTSHPDLYPPHRWVNVYDIQAFISRTVDILHLSYMHLLHSQEQKQNKVEMVKMPE